MRLPQPDGRGFSLRFVRAARVGDLHSLYNLTIEFFLDKMKRNAFYSKKPRGKNSGAILKKFESMLNQSHQPF